MARAHQELFPFPHVRNRGLFSNHWFENRLRLEPEWNGLWDTSNACLFSPAIWNYEVSGKQILRQWFSYRQKNRDRPVMGDRRPPSKLSDIQSDHWLAEYTTELIDLLNVLGLLIELEPQQAALLDRIFCGPLISVTQLKVAAALELPAVRKCKKPPQGRSLFDGLE